VSFEAIVLASIQMLDGIGLRKRVVIVLPERAERCISADSGSV
jgi:hypothetical protein